MGVLNCNLSALLVNWSMIKANELRLGNWIDDQESGIRFIGSIGQYTLSLGHDGYSGLDGRNYSQISPIELTEEWLLKFGFETLNGGFYFLRLKDGYRFEILFREGNIKADLLTFDPQIKYVHQLQNLYFALTGEELECKYPAFPFTNLVK
jgi:hypothetical protein